MDHETERPKPAHDAPAPRSSFVDEPWKLIVFLFVFAGAPGIPAIWASRALTRTSKIILTILVSLYTLAVLALFGWFLIWSYHRFLVLLG